MHFPVSLKQDSRYQSYLTYSTCRNIALRCVYAFLSCLIRYRETIVNSWNLKDDQNCNGIVVCSGSERDKGEYRKLRLRLHVSLQRSDIQWIMAKWKVFANLRWSLAEDMHTTVKLNLRQWFVQKSLHSKKKFMRRKSLTFSIVSTSLNSGRKTNAKHQENFVFSLCVFIFFVQSNNMHFTFL